MRDAYLLFAIWLSSENLFIENDFKFSQNYKISQNYKYNFRKFSEIYIFCLNLIFLIFAYIRLNPSLVCIQDDGYGMADERLSYLLLLPLPVAWPPAWSLINLFV